MTRFRWMSVVPAAVALLAFASLPAAAASVRDRAGMFSPGVVSKVESELDRIERRSGVPVVIETIESLPGVGRDASAKAKSQLIEEVAGKRANEIGYEGVYLLISKNDHVFSPVLVKEHLQSRLPRDKRLAIRDALRDEFKAGRFDQGLSRIAEVLDSSLSGTARTAVPRGAAGLPVQQRAQNRGGSFGIGSLVMIALGIFGILLVLRVLGGLFGRAAGGYSGPANMTGYPGPGMGGGPGYGGPGYGGGYGAPRGGFFSGMLGGLGGALAGNWLYDQFSGRHGQGHTDAGAYYPTDTSAAPDPGNEGFVGGDDNGGGGTSWDDAGGGGGGDWGGGGGDWGGGGGDWGGGGGGGDWGGGGGDGGGW